jgi:tripartite-type tricarboxylate transporter receptor subunit TctC
MNRPTRRAMLGALTLLLTCGSALAQTEKPLRILVGYPPAAPPTWPRGWLATSCARNSGRPSSSRTSPAPAGAGDGLRQIAAGRWQHRGMANSAVMTIAPLVYRKLNYDMARDFVPVAQVANFQLALATGPGSPAKNLKDYVSWLKADTTHAAYASPALGSIPHFFGLMIGKQVGVQMLHVPFNGSAPLMTALVGGQVPASVDTLADLTEMHRAGKIRVLATSGTRRSTALPDVPTFTELGYKDIEGVGRYGFVAPAGTARAAVDRLNAAIARAVASPDLQEKFLKLGLEPQSGSVDAFAKVLASDASRWNPVVKASGFVGD